MSSELTDDFFRTYDTDILKQPTSSPITETEEPSDRKLRRESLRKERTAKLYEIPSDEIRVSLVVSVCVQLIRHV